MDAVRCMSSRASTARASARCIHCGTAPRAPCRGSRTRHYTLKLLPEQRHSCPSEFISVAAGRRQAVPIWWRIYMDAVVAALSSAPVRTPRPGAHVRGVQGCDGDVVRVCHTSVAPILAAFSEHVAAEVERRIAEVRCEAGFWTWFGTC